MTLVLRVLERNILSIRFTSLGSRNWQALDGRHYSSEGPSASNEAQEDSAKRKKEEAKLKLNKLLQSIEKHQPLPPSTDAGGGAGVSGRLAWPGARPRPREVVPAAPRKRRAPASRTPASGQSARQPTLDEQVTAAAREVASSLTGDPAQTERDLLSKLSEDQEPLGAGQADLSELVSGMRVERRPAGGRAQHVRHQLGAPRAAALRQARHQRPAAPRAPQPPAAADVTLNGGELLGIFTALDSADMVPAVSPPPATGQWQRLHARELRLRVAHPPANAWEEMAVWTEQGKLWSLPVDNERGLDREAAVGFHEHVFLEGRLEPWCPPRGPIRQFMELVCVALSKNPWQTVEEKHEHIDWFREYFAGKQRLIEELKAV